VKSASPRSSAPLHEADPWYQSKRPPSTLLYWAKQGVVSSTADRPSEPYRNATQAVLGLFGGVRHDLCLARRWFPARKLAFLSATLSLSENFLTALGLGRRNISSNRANGWKNNSLCSMLEGDCGVFASIVPCTFCFRFTILKPSMHDSPNR